ncbi:methyl-accepting chemotaxis protein [Geomonas sp. RF6]|nr:methyl-accepting chemotaxis protein [Geomonas sp. RF6]UFS71430.1 methyl-accepting chemotaxis protein [Geomonas sp. RF6]
MLKNLTIKKRVFLTLACICVMSVALISLITYQNQMRQLRESVKDLALNEHRLFQSIVSADAEGLARAHAGLDRLEPLLRPFAAKNKDELLRVAAPLFADIKAQNNITHMYFIEPDGKVLLRVHKPEQSGDLVARATFKQAVSSGKTASGVEMGKNFFSLRSVRPVSYNGRAVGYMEVAEEIDHVFTQMKSITGNDESLLLTEEFLAGKKTEVQGGKVGTFRVLYPTNEKITLKLASRILPEMRESLQTPKVQIVSISEGRFAVGMAPVRDAEGKVVGILFSQKEVSSLFASFWKGVLLNVLTICVIFAAALGIFYLSVRKSLRLFETLQRHIVAVTTTWDLSRTIPVETRDEIGQLAEDFNTMSRRLSELVSQVGRSSGELGRVSTDIFQAAGTVMASAEQQASSVNEASSAMTQINTSIKGVAEGVEGLSRSAHETSSSILEMAASVEEVALNAGELAQSVEEVSSAIGEMAASIKEVGSNARTLMEAAYANASSVLEMNSSIKEVELHAVETAAISEGVRRDAELGKEAVEATIVGMARIREASRVTSESVQALSRRAGDIGAMLSVIDDVAGQTSLLALNAAIIAAQSGEHGKGFAVVADEIKHLADRPAGRPGRSPKL